MLALSTSPLARLLCAFALFTLCGMLYYCLEVGVGGTDAFFFCLVTLTTVGYAGLHPAHPVAPVFTGFFVCFAACVLLTFAWVLLRKLVDRVFAAGLAVSSGLLAGVKGDKQPLAERCSLRVKSSAFFIAWLLLACIGFVVYGTMGAEELSWAESFYLAVNTATTVGFGDVVPASYSGRVFWIFWGPSLFVLLALAVLGALERFITARLGAKRAAIRDAAFACDGDYANTFKPDSEGRISEVEFVTKLLTRLKLAPQAAVDEIRAQYRALDADYDGFVSVDEVKRLLKPAVDECSV